MIERWGTMSVKDHLDMQGTVTDALLYDRLVLPVPFGAEERMRWESAGWEPEKQDCVIDILGELAITADWDANRRRHFSTLRRARRQIVEDAFQTSRILLAMDKTIPFSGDGLEIKPIAAYRSSEEGRRELMFAAPDEDAVGRLGFAISKRLLVPSIDETASPYELLRRVADLSLSSDYRRKRSDFFEWQEESVDKIVCGRRSVDSVAREMEMLVDDLNRKVSAHWRKLIARSVLTVVSVALPLAVGPEALKPLAVLPGVFELIKFIALDVDGPTPDEKCQAAAMIVSATKTLG